MADHLDEAEIGIQNLIKNIRETFPNVRGLVMDCPCGCGVARYYNEDFIYDSASQDLAQALHHHVQLGLARGWVIVVEGDDEPTIN